MEHNRWKPPPLTGRPDSIGAGRLAFAFGDRAQRLDCQLKAQSREASAASQKARLLEGERRPLCRLAVAVSSDGQAIFVMINVTGSTWKSAIRRKMLWPQAGMSWISRW